MKHLIRASLVLLLCSCSSLKERKQVESAVSSNAYSFLNAAEKMRGQGQYLEAIDFYNKASRQFLSKLLYREFALSQLKMVMVLIKMEEFDKVLKEVKSIQFYNTKFKLNLVNEIRGVELRYFLARKDEVSALERLGLLFNTKNLHLEKKAYYKSVLLRLDPSKVDRVELKSDFAYLFSSYQSGNLLNYESFIYIGQGILDISDHFEQTIFDRLSIVATDLEMRTLSHYLISYQIRFSTESEKPKLQRLIEFLEMP